MTREEAKQLVRFLAALDGRKVTSDAVEAFHQMLGGYAYAEAKEAAQTAVRNTTRDYATVGEIISVLNGKQVRAGHRSRPECEHGLPLGVPCHDCTHPPDCPACRPVRGISDTPENRRATVRAFASRMGARPNRLPTIHQPNPEGEPEW